MTTTKELIDWCKYKMKRLQRDNLNVIHPDEERFEEVLLRLIAAEKMAKALQPISSCLKCEKGVNEFSPYVASICEIETAQEALKAWQDTEKAGE